MRFNGALGIDPGKWSGLKMAREDNSKLHKTVIIPEDDNMPKFGAGSEYGREAREEARRKKYGGGSRKKYNVDDQPWIMKISEKGARKYRGVKEGGVSENASYYIFTQAVDGAFEVFPVNHWYNFTPIQRYKSLTAEEAEEQFGRRNKIYNYFSVMVRKRLKADDADADGDGEKLPAGKAAKKKSSSGLKVSEMEDWEDSDNDESDDESDKEGADKKPKKKKGGKPKKKKKGSDEEAEEDSDDGDGEGRELDYISDTSETESEDEKEKKNAEIGVDQEAGLKNLLDSDSDEEENQVKDDALDDEEDEEGAEKKNEGEKAETKEKKKTKKKPSKPKDKENPNAMENLSDDDEDEDKSGDELDNAIETAKLESGSSGNNSGNSRDGTPDVDVASGSKRKASSDLINGITNASKKAKIELSPALVQSAASEGITEEAVRRYLLRKPMTVTELLQKFKSKKTKIPSHDMVNVIAHILKKINPVRRNQNQKMYLYLTNKS
ncbi:General transcription factor IIF subunit 1 [Orchesella cincta]|uniref:Transcription initiation factor IIF subunit alpha n=1 Tax=Orchesella cincta TaxID=48709 RepID=A0A1D2NDD3_ORCCI|nr:General transcription factor IIF subunit 1 [Orchesella cincta]